MFSLIVFFCIVFGLSPKVLGNLKILLVGQRVDQSGVLQRGCDQWLGCVLDLCLLAGNCS